jgi:hypothetical protein
VQLKERHYNFNQGVTFIALQYGNLRDKEKVLVWMDRMLRDGGGDLILLLKSAPEFDFVRSDERFAALVRRIGLPQ